MGGVTYRLRSVLRRRWARTLAVTSIVAAVCSIVITIAAGAHRTATAPDRYTSASTLTADGIVTQEKGGRPQTNEVAALPGVAAIDGVTFVFGGIAGPRADELSNVLLFTGSPRAVGAALVSGRLAAPDNEHEFVATQSFFDEAHASLGDSFDFAALSQDQADKNGFTGEPQGPRFAATLVGVVDGPGKLDDSTPLIVVSPALLDEPDLGIKVTMMAVDLRPGVDLSQFRAQLDTLPDGAGLSLRAAALISDEVRRAVQTQARGLWLLALATAIAAVAALGQLITRQVRPTRAERERLTAVGFTNTQVIAEAMGQAMVPITLGALLGAAVAVAPSGVFPTGFVRVIEPSPGLLVDWEVLAGGAVVFIVALALWTLVSLTLTGSTVRSALPSPTVEAVASRTASPAAATGMRLAFGNFADGRGSARGAMIGVILTVAGVTAAITFGASLDRLVDEPFRYGSYYDVALGGNGAEQLPDGFTERIDANPDVTSLTRYTDDFARVGELNLPILGMDVISGDGTPTVLSGRIPVSNDEIALGRVSARAIGVDVGDAVTIVGDTDSAVFRVSGLVVMPGFGSNDGLGVGGVVTTSGLARIDDAAPPTILAVQLSSSVAEFATSVPELGGVPPDSTYVPAAIVNVSRIRAIPFALAAVLAALTLLTVGHVMVTSTRGSRRELAILRSLGAGVGWISRAVHWHATLFTLVCATVGIPLGVITGRLVWIAFAQNMGAIDGALVPVAALGVGVLTIVALANVTAAIPARRARRVRPAQLLRTE